MCGIVGFTGSQQAAPILLDGLKKLEYRGYDSAGIAALCDSGIHMEKASGKIKNLDAKIDGGRRWKGTAASATPAGPPTARPRMRTPTPT